MKVPLIVLAVIAALFVLGLCLRSKGQDDDQAKADPKAYVQNHPMPAWTDLLGAALDPLAPKVKPQPALYKLTPLARSAIVKLPPGNDDHRKANFTVSGAAAVSVVYEPPATPPIAEADASLREQRWPNEKTKDPHKGSFIILRGGGVLKFTLPPGARGTCAVEFQ